MLLDKITKLGVSINECENNILEAAVRNLLIKFFFHISNKSIILTSEFSQKHTGIIRIITPTIFRGLGCIKIGSGVNFGVLQSPGSFSCSYIEARSQYSTIEIGASTYINNIANIIAEGPGISIGERCLIGQEVYIIDSNFHCLEIANRDKPDLNPLKVFIGNDVFIGSRVTILKGVCVGNGSVIAAGSVLLPRTNYPPFSIIAGSPAKVVGSVT